MKPEASEIVSAVMYEWKMLNWTCEQICWGHDYHAEAPKVPPLFRIEHFIGTSLYEIDDYYRSALLESFLLHARTVRDFLCSNSKKWQDDVLAIDFFEHPSEWTKTRPDLGPYSTLTVDRERINKSLAHLSYARIEYAKKDNRWEILGIQHELSELWNAFLEALPSEKSNWFQDSDCGAD